MNTRKITRYLAVCIATLLLAGTVLPGLAQADSAYVVRSGDTLSAIAARNGVTVASLVAANGIANPNLIFVGQRLTIPGDSQPAAVENPTPVARPAASPGSILADRRIVSYYGNPFSGQMGILGQLSKSELVAALQRRAAQYEAVSGDRVQPAIHMVATVAQEHAGADGLYRARMPYSVVEEYANLAAANDMLFFIDIQPGRSTVEAELEPWLPLLRQPHIHLAIDPEFNMRGNQRPGVQLGHMTADEINYTQRVLSRLVAENGLPNKIFMVYQFAASMLPDKHRIYDDPNVDFVVNMDGFGYKSVKVLHYNLYVRDEPVGYAGFKLFLDQDPDLMTPAEVMALEPKPDVIQYQ